MEKSSGFDMSKLSTASKIVMVSGILLFVDSFLSWQKVCVDFGGRRTRRTSVGRRTPGAGTEAGPASSWGSSCIVLLIWEGIQLATCR